MGADAETMEGVVYLLAHHGLLILLSHRTQDNLPRNEAIHSGLGPLPAVTN